jgi:hypothetical protein
MKKIGSLDLCALTLDFVEEKKEKQTVKNKVTRI